MIPLRLTISGFMSYCEETTLDFTRFGKKGLYLITGDTGAGKTTIFDAISYALFGTASGELRDKKEFRCRSASLDTPTFVKLLFESQGTVYLIERRPAQERRYKKGDKTTTESASAKITTMDENGKPVRTVKLTEALIKEIIGIDSEKFKQLSIIAQGDFMKVLNASTEKRREILRQIFDTYRYERLENELKAVSAEYKDRYSLKKAELCSRVSMITCAENSRFQLLADEIRPMYEDKKTAGGRTGVAIIEFSPVLSLLESLIAEDEETMRALSEDNRKSDERLSVLAKTIGEEKQKARTKQLYENTKKKLHEETERLPLLQKGFESVSGNEEKANQLVVQSKLIADKLTDFEKLEAAQTEYVQADQDRQKLVRSRQQYADEHQQCMQELDKDKEELLSLKDCAAELAQKVHEQQELERQFQSVVRLHRMAKELAALLEDIADKQQQFKNSENVYKQRKDRYDRYLERFLNEQAGIIANSLSVGDRCPVCGNIITSPEHLAGTSAEAPSKQMVDKARTEAEKAAADMQKAAGEAQTAVTKHQAQKKAVDEAAMELFEEALEGEALVEAVIALGKEKRAAKNAADTAVAVLKEQQTRKASLEQSIPELEKCVTELHEKIVDADKQTALLLQRREVLEVKIAELKAALPFESKAQATAKINACNSEAKQLRKALQSAKKALDDCVAATEAAKKSIEEFEKLDFTPRADVEMLEREEAEGRKHKTELTGKIGRVGARITANKSIQDYIRQNEGELKTLSDQYAQVYDLDLTASGGVTGAEKLSFETFLQQIYFKSIIAYANRRLYKMSGGKYDLRLSEKARDNVSKSGLDLDVYDYRNRTTRPVSMLSGGESFLGSMALALGFSDVIQSSIGGIHLDAMFIDEGFGTLDEQTLEDAFRVFNDLSNNGNCLVGIISHIEELKERISDHIEVTKNQFGCSNAVIVKENTAY